MATSFTSTTALFSAFPQLSQTYPCLHPRLLWLQVFQNLRLCRHLRVHSVVRCLGLERKTQQPFPNSFTGEVLTLLKSGQPVSLLVSLNPCLCAVKDKKGSLSMIPRNILKLLFGSTTLSAVAVFSLRLSPTPPLPRQNLGLRPTSFNKPLIIVPYTQTSNFCAPILTDPNASCRICD